MLLLLQLILLFFYSFYQRIHLYYFNIMNWNDSSEGILCVLLNYWDLIIIKLWQMTYIFIVYFCRCMAKEWNKIQLGSKYCHERAFKIYRCYVRRQCKTFFFDEDSDLNFTIWLHKKMYNIIKKVLLCERFSLISCSYISVYIVHIYTKGL